jgi:hypothetical protein
VNPKPGQITQALQLQASRELSDNFNENKFFVELAEDFLHDYELVGFQTTVE